VVGAETEFYLALGGRIRDLRKARRMTQATLADIMEIPRTSLILVERGDQRVHTYELTLLASALGARAEDLIQDAAPAPPDQLTVVPLDTTPAIREWISAAQAPVSAPTTTSRRRR